MATDAVLLETREAADEEFAPRRKARSYDEPTGIRRIGRYLLLGVVAFVVLFPIYTTVIAALTEV